MNICFFHYTYPGIGGTETVTNLLAEQFRNLGHAISVITWQRNDNVPLCVIDDVCILPDVKRLNSEENAEFIHDYLKSNHIDCLINQGPFWTPTLKIKQLSTVVISVLHYSPDYKIVNQKNAITECFHRKSPTISHFIKSVVRYVFRETFAIRDFNKEYKKEFQETIANSDRFVVLCDEYVQDLKKLIKCDYSNIIAVSNGLKITDETFPKEKTVVCIGRLSKWDKRVDRLLYIWRDIEKLHGDWSLLILGDGPERPALECLAEALRLKSCRFMGFVDVRPFLEKASILAMTSSSEGFPMVILEAANYGVVPVAYNISHGVSHLIDNSYNGLLIEPFDQKRYIRELSALMSNSEKLGMMSEHVKRSAYKYDIRNIAEKWLSIINEVKNEKS